jgi:hypothetical protein
MHSTEVEVLKTCGDIHGYLVRMGANQIMTEYAKGIPVGLCFTLSIDGKNVPFRLPARVEPVYKILHAGRMSAQAAADMAQAERVAWRQIYRWIQSQLALIETGMVEAAEILTPFRQISPTQTLYEAITTGRFQNMLPESTEITQP